MIQPSCAYRNYRDSGRIEPKAVFKFENGN